ncbi:MAG: calcium-binding protein [Candidatus Melainabacteria bacterium]|nr:calcium-binding protein [Candidatus Melainabacteria bacterium]
MKILITMAHFYRFQPGAGYGSSHASAKRRIQSLAQAILAFHQHFGPHQAELNHAQRLANPVNQAHQHEIKIVIWTDGKHHLLDQLPLSQNLYEHRIWHGDPKALGFACQGFLGECAGDYDYYGFIEDDLVIQDAWFFEKLRRFNALVAPDTLLQPNRFELSSQGPVYKFYIDGPLHERASEPFQNRQEKTHLQAKIMGQPLQFYRPSNPHAGCYFLNQAQLRHWMAHPVFLQQAPVFIGPLETAATMGIMRAFRVYKPHPSNAHFLELLHACPSFIHQVGQVIQQPEGATT